MPSAISLRRVTKVFRSTWTLQNKPVLHGIDLEVEQGKIFGFLGPNGAGKTTTIKILVGLSKPTTGTASLFGQSAALAASRRDVGFLPENPYFYEYLTAEESLRFYGSLFNVERGELDRRTGHLLEEFGLAGARKQRVRTFSKGMRQRLGMAQALIGEPRLVILDEPQSGLDPIGRYEVKSAIARLRESGVTVFFSSHVLADVEDLCDDVGLLIKGELTQAGSLSTLLADQSQKYELQFRGVGPEQLAQLENAGLSGRSRGDLVTYQVERPEDIGAVLDRVRGAGGQVVALNPVRETLEDYFVRVAQS